MSFISKLILLVFVGNCVYASQYDYIKNTLLEISRDIMKNTYDQEKGVYHINNLDKKNKQAYNFTFKHVLHHLKSDSFDLYEMLAEIVYDIFYKNDNNLTINKIKSYKGFKNMVEAFSDYFAHNYIDKMAVSKNTPLTGWGVKCIRMQVGKNKIYVEIETETKYPGDSLTSTMKWVVKKPVKPPEKIIILDLVVEGLSFKDAQTAQWRDNIHKKSNPEELIDDLTSQFKRFKPAY